MELGICAHFDAIAGLSRILTFERATSCILTFKAAEEADCEVSQGASVWNFPDVSCKWLAICLLSKKMAASNLV